MDTISTSVVVVGGSLVGLSAAAFLAWQRVPTVVIEQHRGSSPHPRAMGYTPRTLELYDVVGLAGQIPAVPPSFRLRRRKVESLAGRWLDETDWTPGKPSAKSDQGPATDPPTKPSDLRAKEPPTEARPTFSPHTGAAIAQDRLEPLLRERARELGADLRLGTSLLSFSQDADGVTAHVRDRATGHEYTVRAAYLIAADGSRSAVRDALGIGRSGRGHIRTVRSVLFRAPLDEYLASGISQFEIEQPGFQAFLTTYNDGRWVLMFSDDIERSEGELREAVQRAIGRTDLPVEIITTGRWELSALITDQFSAGRVFLAGDSAHTLPPTRGGFGANTGIQDAHNLAWKLASVLSGASTPALLDTYHAERHPVAWQRLLQTFARPDYAAAADGIADGVAILDDAAMEFGQLHRSSAIIGAGDELPPAARPDQWIGQPGTRAPYVPLSRGTSTLDLLGRGWALVADDDAWRVAATHASARLGIDVTVLRIGDELPTDDGARLRAAFGLPPGGASLVRPDGIVAWRAETRPADAASALTDALAQVVSAARR